MSPLSFGSLIKTFFKALIAYTFGGLGGWIGIVLVLLRITGIIHWQWWVVTLPLEYGVFYCLYMTIDGAFYRSGKRDAGRYARFTQPFLQSETYYQTKIQEIISGGPERIGETIDALCEEPNSIYFAQTLLDAALEPYFLLQLAMFANKKENAYVTIKKWKDAGLKLPDEGTPEFFPYGD